MDNDLNIFTGFLNYSTYWEKIQDFQDSGGDGVGICSDLPNPLQQKGLPTKHTTRIGWTALNEQLNDVSLQPISKLLKLVALYY